MSCNVPFADCLETVSTECISWQGPDIPCLGITKGMILSVVENTIATELCNLSNEVDVSTLVLKGDLVGLLGTKNKTIVNLLQILVDYDITLKGLIDAIRIDFEAFQTFVVDYKCLVGAVSSIQETDIQTAIQRLIDYCCYLNGYLAEFVGTIDSRIDNRINSRIGGMIYSKVGSTVIPSGSGSNYKVEIRGFVPPYVAVPYFGGLEFFDNSGRGIVGTFMETWLICNGKNGTPDLRGRIPVGANTGSGSQGGELPTDVDPIYNGGMAVYSWGAGQGGAYGGEMRHRLSIPEIPSHKHDPYDIGHVHGQYSGLAYGVNGGSGQNVPIEATPQDTKVGYAQVRDNLRGGDGHHNNMQPYCGAVWIMWTQGY